MRTFTDTLKDLRSGAAETDASTALAEVVRAVRETGLTGSMTIEIKLKPVTKGDGKQLIVEDVIKVKKPMPQRGNTVLFATDTDVLTRRDPNQPELKGLREVAPVTPFTPRPAEDTATVPAAAEGKS